MSTVALADEPDDAAKGMWLVTLVLPETLGRPLPETVADCEPAAAVAPIRPHSPADFQTMG